MPRPRSATLAALPLCHVAALPLCHAQADWPFSAANLARTSSALAGPPALGGPSWVASRDGGGTPLTFVGQSGPVIAGDRAYALGRVGDSPRLMAFDTRGGALLWAGLVPAPVLESWSSPAIDIDNGAVLAASGTGLRAFVAADGRLLWSRTLPRRIANASPLVTSDLDPADRIYISDFSTAGDGQVHCFNADPFDATLNPHQPGDPVWSVTLGWTSGNTPAYADGTVYVASISDETGLSPGRVHALDARTGAVRWVFDNVKPEGFFGGVCVSGGAVFAATYAFSGGRQSANLVKLDAATGDLVWSADCNRTSSIPVPLPGGFIALSTGVPGFGSACSVHLFADRGTHAERLWDTAESTWNDTNNNGVIEPGEYFLVGAWNTQPAANPQRNLLVVGVPPLVGSRYDPCTDLYAIDYTRRPTDPGFIVDHFVGAGSASALAGDALFTIGGAGLHAFNTCPADCDRATGPGVLDIFDFLCFQNLFAAGAAGADCDPGTGPRVLDIFDFLCFQNHFARGCP